MKTRWHPDPAIGATVVCTPFIWCFSITVSHFYGDLIALPQLVKAQYSHRLTLRFILSIRPVAGDDLPTSFFSEAA